MGGGTDLRDISEQLLKTMQDPQSTLLLKHDVDSVIYMYDIKVSVFTGCFLNREVNKNKLKEKNIEIYFS